MYELIEEASQVLREPAPNFDFENPIMDPKELSEKLSETMDKYGGLGLSANQVGIPAKVFVMKTADKGNVAFFNPEITQASQETELMTEGCLSFPDLFLNIKRSKAIGFKYQDENGEDQELVLDGIGARCVQHELDHLNGIIFLQRASRLKIERALKARPKNKQKRLEYETRRAIAEKLQEIQAAKNAEGNNGDGSSEVDGLPQEQPDGVGDMGTTTEVRADSQSDDKKSDQKT